ncbi:MAG: NifU family protein [Methylocystaceae bacterium]
MLAHIQQIIDQYIAPALSEHGGGIELVEYTSDGTLRIRLLGQCCNCPASKSTIDNLIMSTLQEHLPEITKIELVETPEALELIEIAREILHGKPGYRS